MIDWIVYWFMFPACILIATFAMLTGISGTAMLTPFIILAFPAIGVPILTPAATVGMALLTEFCGFTSGLIGYHRTRLIDYKTGWKLISVGVPTIVAFSIVSQSVSSLELEIAYGVMMILLSIYLFLTAPGNVRNRALEKLPRSAERIPRRNEGQIERVIRTKGQGEYRYRVCDQGWGYAMTCAGAAMEGLVSVGLGELEMPNLVKRCKIPVSVSAATSVFIIAITVLSGSITSIVALVQRGGLMLVPWNLVFYTIPGALIGGQLGARYQGKISSENMERLIAILFVTVGAAFLYTSLPSLL